MILRSYFYFEGVDDWQVTKKNLGLSSEEVGDGEIGCQGYGFGINCDGLFMHRLGIKDDFYEFREYIEGDDGV